MKKSICFILLSILVCFFCFSCNNTQNVPEPPEQEYVITFDTADGNTIDSFIVKVGDMVVLPTPERDGYVFINWVIKGTETVVSSGEWTKRENVELLAVWEAEVIEEQEYVITFDTAGGNTIESITVKVGDTVVLPIPERDGYVFINWVIKGTETVVISGEWTKRENVELLAVWEAEIIEEKEYVITFDTAYENTIDSMTVKVGDMVVLPTPERDSYIFVKWVIKGTETVVTSGEWTIEEDVELLAVWKFDYTFIY